VRTHSPTTRPPGLRWRHPRAPRAARVALGARAPERSAVAVPWLLACAPVAVWLWADAVATNSTAVAARHSAPEMCRMSMTRICSLVLSRRMVSKAPRAVNCRARDGSCCGSEGFHVEQSTGSSPLNHPVHRSASSRQLTLRPEALGTRARRGTEDPVGRRRTRDSH
jgi:hypothetical protein